MFYKNTKITDIDGEVWLPIPSFEKNYCVSNKGRVFSHRNNLIMKQNFSRDYLILGLIDDVGKKHTMRVHRLVLMAFKPEGYLSENEGNHINGIKTDNRDVNLEWTSHQDNSRKMYINNHYSKKLKYGDVVCIKQMLEEGIKGTIIASKFNISPVTISEIKNKRKWVDV
jgi:hypothetical protein